MPCQEQEFVADTVTWLVYLSISSATASLRDNIIEIPVLHEQHAATCFLAQFITKWFLQEIQHTSVQNWSISTPQIQSLGFQEQSESVLVSAGNTAFPIFARQKMTISGTSVSPVSQVAGAKRVSKDFRLIW